MLVTPDVPDPIAAWPKLTAPQWEQVRRLIADLDKQANGSPEAAEQRSCPRRAVAFPIRLMFGRTTLSDGACWAIARNISRGGISVMVRRMFHLADRVVVQLPTPGNNAQPRSVNARVVRCRYIGDLYHEIGLTFTAGSE